MHTKHKHAAPAHSGPAASVSAEAIRLCAYRKWESAGKPAGDGIRFWLEAEQELLQGTSAISAERGARGYREHERPEKPAKARTVSVDSHYRDNNRMFQTHGERGHRHGGSG